MKEEGIGVISEQNKEGIFQNKEAAPSMKHKPAIARSAKASEM